MKKFLFALITAAFVVSMALPALAQYPPVGPTPGDIDGDGIPDTEDPDADGDGIPNDQDDDADGNGIPDSQQPDSDCDGLPDTIDGTDNNLCTTPGGGTPPGGGTTGGGTTGGGTTGTPQQGSPTPSASGLATTGIETSLIAAWSAVLLLIGAALVVTYRRRGDAA